VQRTWSVRRVVALGWVLTSLTITGHSIARDRELTESSDFRVRVQAALRLGRSGSSARPDLEFGLRDAHPGVRVACAVALGNIGEAESIPPLETAMTSESFPSVKSAMKDAIEKIRGTASVKSANPSAPTSLVGASYVVQLGSMHNISGVRADDLDGVMRQAARAKAGTIKGAVVVDGSDPSVLKKATEKRIPVLQVDGNLTKLTQITGNDGGTVVTAKVDMSIRKLPGQTLKGTVSGNASASHSQHVEGAGMVDLQNRVVGGAVESALRSMSSELALLSK
jgi:hypothetical protein